MKLRCSGYLVLLLASDKQNESKNRSVEVFGFI